MNLQHRNIIKDPLIWKFSAYGLLKNLKFFEPYLLIYLTGMGQDLFRIGILYAIREAVAYIFEIPSGVLADNYGKKKELMACFVFYIISFGLFFAGSNFFIFALAMIFFGLGEAFRSGTHKAMIYSYLERKDWFDEKTFVYGRTRSFSLTGSSISSFISIIFVLNLPALRWIFLASTIPYILDFLLIWSYPDYLDERHVTDFSFRSFLALMFLRLREITRRPLLRKIILSSSLFDGLFRSIKDYIQPILALLLLSTLGVDNTIGSGGDFLKISLGVIYGFFYIFSAAASRNVHRLHRFKASSTLMNVSFSIMGVVFLLISFAVKKQMSILVILLYLVLYVIKDGRRPIFVDISGDWMKKEERATVMSMDSQLRAVITVIAAPVAGLIAEKLSISMLFLILGILTIFASRFIVIKDQ